MGNIYGMLCWFDIVYHLTRICLSKRREEFTAMLGQPFTVGTNELGAVNTNEETKSVGSIDKRAEVMISK